MNRRSFITAGLGSLPLAAVHALKSEDDPLIEAAEKSFDLNIKITDLRTFVVDAGNDENFVYVQLYTNQGIIGLGEGTMTAKARSVEAAIQEHKRYLVGKDPTEIERHWQGMFRGPRYRGGPVMTSALSAVEIALWDILGQALKAPIWQLLGGKARDRIRVYPHSGREKKGPRTAHRTGQPNESKPRFKAQSKDWLEREVENWVMLKEAGWTAGKGNFLPKRGDIIEPLYAVREGIRMLEAVRQAVGWEFDILVELHGQATPPMARDFCKGAEPYRPMFVEEPAQLEDLGEWEILRKHTSVPLATGERLFTKYGFAELCARHLVDYVQPDVVHAGGILELKKIGAIAEAFRIDLAPHNPQSEVSTIASMHVCACTPNAVILEIGSGQTPFFQDLFNGGLFRVENGYAPLPNRPGLGLTLNEEIASKYPYEPKSWHTPVFSDGAWADR